MLARRVAATAALTALAVVGVSAFEATPAAQALSQDYLDDMDGDLLPDGVELLLGTNPMVADTDEDGINDLEEAVTFTNHLEPGAVKPLDSAMRVVVTSSPNLNGGSDDVYLHLLLRTVASDANQASLQDVYADLGGYEMSLIGLLGSGEIRVAQATFQDRTLLMFSARLCSTSDLSTVLPVTIGARAYVAGRSLDTGAYVMDSADGQIVELVPASESSMVALPVASDAFLQETNPYYNGGGRVCEMGLVEIGRGTNGTLCEVSWAACRPAARLHCTVACPDQAGSFVRIPGGLDVLTGGN